LPVCSFVPGGFCAKVGRGADPSILTRCREALVNVLLASAVRATPSFCARAVEEARCDTLGFVRLFACVRACFESVAQGLAAVVARGGSTLVNVLTVTTDAVTCVAEVTLASMVATKAGEGIIGGVEYACSIGIAIMSRLMCWVTRVVRAFGAVANGTGVNPAALAVPRVDLWSEFRLARSRRAVSAVQPNCISALVRLDARSFASHTWVTCALVEVYLTVLTRCAIRTVAAILCNRHTDAGAGVNTLAAISTGATFAFVYVNVTCQSRPALSAVANKFRDGNR
jgi:hypothetical protein